MSFPSAPSPWTREPRRPFEGTSTTRRRRSTRTGPLHAFLAVLAAIWLASCANAAGSPPTVAPATMVVALDRLPSAGPRVVRSTGAALASSVAASATAGGGPTSLPTTGTAISGRPVVAEPRVIELEETAALQITQIGQPVADIPVTPGETIRFVITNTAGFDHNFYIGTDDQLAFGRVEGLAGLSTWSNDHPMAFDWSVPQELGGIRFGCTLRGHYPRMQGTFSVMQ